MFSNLRAEILFSVMLEVLMFKLPAAKHDVYRARVDFSSFQRDVKRSRVETDEKERKRESEISSDGGKCGGTPEYMHSTESCVTGEHKVALADENNVLLTDETFLLRGRRWSNINTLSAVRLRVPAKQNTRSRVRFQQPESENFVKIVKEKKKIVEENTLQERNTLLFKKKLLKKTHCWKEILIEMWLKQLQFSVMDAKENHIFA